MRLSPIVVLRLALMVCGDEAYNGIFPYRTSSYITQFFHGIDLDYSHDGSTRKWWVQSVLEQLNYDTISASPSKEMISVITQLLNPIEFASSTNPTNYKKALEMMNVLLRSQDLTVQADESSGKVFLKGMKGDFISTAVDGKKVEKVITFCPEVFSVPACNVNRNLVSVMMPFDMEFQEVYDTIRISCSNVGLECKRVDDIWKNSVIIQDIFELIYSSSIVVADLSGKNPNVFYEVGIAHTLGKSVVPIIRNMGDIPFDLRHHRALVYLNNKQGRDELRIGLEARLKTLKG